MSSLDAPLCSSDGGENILAGVLAAAEYAFPGKGIMDLLAWGAACRGDTATLSYLLANGAKPTWAPSKQDGDGYDDKGRGCSIAPFDNNVAVRDVMLKTQSNVNRVAPENGAFREILKAGKEGHEDIVAELLKTGANTDEAANRDRHGTTPLLTAIWNGHAAVMEQLLESGADVNEPSSDDGSTPLLHATMKGRIDIVERLIHAGADLDKARTDDGTTPLIMASGRGSELLVELLLRTGADVNKARMDDGSTALGMAAMDGNEHIVKLLIKAGALIVMESGESALTVAAHGGYIGVCSVLIKADANINHVCGQHGETPLNVAVRAGRRDTAIFLLSHGACMTGGIFDQSMRQKLAKWLVQELMQNDEALDERRKLKAKQKWEQQRAISARYIILNTSTRRQRALFRSTSAAG